MIRALAAFVFAFCVALPSASAQNAAPAIATNQPIEGAVGATETPRYSLRLRRGEFVHLTVEPRNVRLRIRLIGPDARTVIETVGLGIEEPQWLSAIATTAGDYTLELRAVDQENAVKGHYVVRLAERRTATSADRKRLVAQQAFIDGGIAASARTRDGYESSIDKYREAIEAFSAADRSLESAAAYAGLALALDGLQRYAPAADAYERALAVYRSAKKTSAELNVLGRLGFALYITDKFEPAMSRYEEALTLARALGERAEEAHALIFISFSSEQLKQYERGLQAARQAVAIRHELNDKPGEAQALSVLASAHRNLAQTDEAVGRSQEEITIRQALGDRSGEATAVHDVAFAYLVADRFGPAAEWFEKAVALQRDLGNLDDQINSLKSLAFAYRKLHQTDDAVRASQRLLEIQRARKDRKEEASALDDIAFAYDEANQYEKSVDVYSQALAIQQQLGDKEAAAHSLFFMAMGSRQLGRYDKALEYAGMVQTLRRELHDRAGEALAIEDIGMTLDAMGQQQRAVAQFETALAVRRELKDGAGEISDLRTLARVHGIRNPELATSLYEQVLALQRQRGDLAGQGKTLNALGAVQAGAGHLNRELDYYQQALAIARQTGQRTNEALALFTLGTTYGRLGVQAEALSHFQQALAIGREVGNTTIQAGSLTAVGLIKGSMGLLQSAVQDLEQSLALDHQSDATRSQASTTAALGLLYARLGQADRAAETIDQAAALAQRSSNPLEQANTLTLKGAFLARMNRLDEAAAALRQALSIVQQFKIRELEGDILTGLMTVLARAHQPRLAIAYGKRSINVIQELRDENATLDQTLQRSFIEGRSSRYRQLADLLAGQGRLAEAQQVLDMLKTDEFSEFVMRDRTTTGDKGRVALTAEEAAWESRYEAIADRLTTVGSERRALLSKPDRTPAEDKTLASLEVDLEAGNHAFQTFLDDMQHAFEGRKSSDQVARVRDAEGLMETLRDLGPGSVAVYTVVGEQGYRSILVTSDVEKGYTNPIAAADLNRKILAFREAVRNPAIDPRPIAKELYDILVKPMEKDLEGAGAKTIMWSLDGALRYMPVAALYDGRRYLVERFQNVVFTPASQSRLKDPVSRDWRGAGFGVSLAHDQFQALPNVPGELRSIINASPESSRGVLPGIVKLDAEFTKDDFRTELRNHYTVVHVASHFDFSPGRDRDSFLLLGDGSRLTLEEFRNMPQVLQGVELLTLSACDTAVGGEDADGREVEGLAVLAQRQGAKAVLATLWAVADESTALLMREFYRLRTTDPSITKAEALRQAQLALLSGKIRGADSNDRGVRLTSANGAARPAMDSGRPYAHPYFWAPFLLMGNWK